DDRRGGALRQGHVRALAGARRGGGAGLRGSRQCAAADARRAVLRRRRPGPRRRFGDGATEGVTRVTGPGGAVARRAGGGRAAPPAERAGGAAGVGGGRGRGGAVRREGPRRGGRRGRGARAAAGEDARLSRRRDVTTAYHDPG